MCSLAHCWGAAVEQCVIIALFQVSELLQFSQIHTVHMMIYLLEIGITCKKQSARYADCLNIFI